MIIRRAELRDMDGINELLRQVLYVHHRDRPDTFKACGKKYRDEELQKIIGDDSTPVFVAVGEQGEVLGHCFTVLKEVRGHRALEDMKTRYIDDLCIDESQRGQHIGSAFYEHTHEFARQCGCYNVTLNAWTKNEKALRFYESKGLSVQKIGMEIVL